MLASPDLIKRISNRTDGTFQMKRLSVSKNGSCGSQRGDLDTLTITAARLPPDTAISLRKKHSNANFSRDGRSVTINPSTLNKTKDSASLDSDDIEA